jgi:hypothetical protein
MCWMHNLQTQIQINTSFNFFYKSQGLTQAHSPKQVALSSVSFTKALHIKKEFSVHDEHKVHSKFKLHFIVKLPI